MELVSIIVLTYQSEKYIEKCINSIFKSEYKNFELIVVDNNSTDQTRKILSSLETNNSMKIILNSKNLGYNQGNLLGIKNCNGDYIAVINPDVYIDKDWIKNIMRVFSENPKLIAISGTLLNGDKTIQSLGGMMDRFGAVQQKKNNKNEGFFYNPGAAYIFHKSILKNIQFDPNLFMYYDDVDFAWQAHLLGYLIGYCDNAKAIHFEGQSQPGLTLDKFYNISKNRIYVCLKNYSFSRIFKRSFIIIFLVLIDGIYYSKQFKSYRYFFKALNAIMWNITNFRKISKSRKTIQKLRKVKDDEIEKKFFPKSIELEFLRNVINSN